MKRQWTPDQKSVIDARNGSLLVSAAAGSGKTAVLVERIISMVTDAKNPVDIDRLLVVTFTNAAAAQMRDRLRTALMEKLSEDNGNEHLQRQISLLQQARISTIHAFCLDVVRNHFQEAGIDPSFRVADEGEMKLLERDVISDLLEEEYEKKDPAFLHLAETISPGRGDTELEELILTFYRESMAFPRSAQWRAMCAKVYDVKSGEDIENSRWMSEYLKDVKEQFALMQAGTQRLLGMCSQPDGPKAYIPALESDLEMYDAAVRCRTYGEIQALLYGFSFENLGRKKETDVSQIVREQVKNGRDKLKEEAKKIKAAFARPLDDILEKMKAMYPVMEELCLLTDRFEEAFMESRLDRNILDFSDQEHLALKVLTEEKDGQLVPSAAAKEYARSFHEIMIDEYQDSNLVQEMLLGAVSGRGGGINNIFMVGDVKQSIYRFRQARPELFMEKMGTYTKTPGDKMRIDLQMNFRSRYQILDFVNHLFASVMHKEVGGVEYDDYAMLRPGPLYDGETEEQEASGDPYIPEVLLVDIAAGELPDGARTKEEPDGENNEGEDTDPFGFEEPLPENEEMEIRVIGERIRAMVGHEKIRDEKGTGTRFIRYSDIAVLFRSSTAYVSACSDVFSDMGIPSYTGSGTGYFSAPEIRLMLNLLAVLDNPRQDIPLAAVLRSPIGKFTDEDLAMIRCAGEKLSFYDACRVKSQEEGDTPERLSAFFEWLESVRTKLAGMPLHQLITWLLDETGYGSYAASLPDGGRRYANLMMLAMRAADYEKGSYRGLFHFIRYIENLRKYEIDYGEAQAGGENEDTVKLMTIHKSKGLEFPVVFVCGMGRKYNRADERSRILFHADLGAGMDYFDPASRVRAGLPLRAAFRERIRSESMGEELRVLYVAMTRAMQKLILTGFINDVDKEFGRWESQDPDALSPADIRNAGRPLDTIMPSVLSQESEGRVLIRLERPGKPAAPSPQEHGAAAISVQRGVIYDEETAKVLAECAADKEPPSAIPLKVSVSQLKIAAMPEEDEDESFKPFHEETREHRLPRFLQQSRGISAGERGTLYHTVMENLDFLAPFDDETAPSFVKAQLESMIKCGKIQKNNRRYIDPAKITAFWRDPLARRMQEAAKQGNLKLESPFVMGITAQDLEKQAFWKDRPPILQEEKQEMVLVQGIIDAWFIEDGEIILLDYKTDRTDSGETLARRYKSQLDNYAAALEKLTGLKVKEKILYSLYLGRTITV